MYVARCQAAPSPYFPLQGSTPDLLFNLSGRQLVQLLLAHALARVMPAEAWLEGTLMGLGRAGKQLGPQDW